MAASRTVSVNLVADAAKLEQGFRRAGKSADGFGRKLGGPLSGGLGKLKLGLIGAGAAAGAGLTVALKGSIDAAIEAEKAQANLSQALKAVGADTAAMRGKVDAAVTSLSMMSGFDDEDLSDAFSNLARTSGDAEGSLKNFAAVADLARAKNMSLQQASTIVGRVMNGNTGILKRYGITLEKGATAQEALAALQQKFGGAAEAYGKTTAGSLDRAKVAVGNLQESLGKQLAPAVAWLAEKGVQYINEFGPVIEQKLGKAVAWVKANWPQIKKTVQTTMAALKPIVKPILDQIVAIVKLAGAVMRGDWSAAWSAIKDIVRAKIAEVRAVLGAAVDGVRAAADRIGNAIQNRISDGAEDAAGAAGRFARSIPGRLRDALGAIGSAASSIGSRIWSGITGALGDLGGYIAGKVRSAVNAVISIINGLRIPQFTAGFRTPSFGIPTPFGSIDVPSIGKTFTIGPFDLPNLPYLGGGRAPTGGASGPKIAASASPSRIGAGVALASSSGGGAGSVVINVAGSVVTERDLMQLVRRELQAQARRNGRALGVTA